MPNIFLGGWMLIIASILKPHWEFHIKGEGLRVGRGDILILGLWTRDRIISANLGPERLLSSLASSQPFFFFPPSMHFLSIPRLSLLSLSFTSASFQGGKVHLLWPRSPC